MGENFTGPQPTEGPEDNQLLLRLDKPNLLPTHSRKGTRSYIVNPKLIQKSQY